jgi:hypothetical protein
MLRLKNFRTSVEQKGKSKHFLYSPIILAVFELRKQNFLTNISELPVAHIGNLTTLLAYSGTCLLE